MSHIVGSHEVIECGDRRRTFEWVYPITGFLLSGWFVAAYFAFSIGFDKMMANLPPGTVLNVIPPTIWILIAIIINMISWLAAVVDCLNIEPISGESK